MKTNRIKLTESQLHQIIKKSVKKVLNEEKRTSDWSEYVQNIGHEIDNKLSKLSSLLYDNRSWNGAMELFDKIHKIQQEVRDTFYTNHVFTYDWKGEESKEPEDWYERNEHGDFDEF